jgi:hypothetical protein
MIQLIRINMPTSEDGNSITGVRIDIARLEGMLSQFLTDGIRRIENGEKETRQLRVDLTAVKDEGNRKLEETNTRVTQNTSGINELRTDMQEVKTKQDGSWGKVWLVLSFAVSTASVVWNVLGGK